jgi:cell division protein FtsB
MTIGEFQNHTDMYPDFTLYEAACKEYEKKNPDGSPAWDSQAQFCNAYKFNEDGLAERIMHSANERVESWISDNVRLKSELEPLADRCEKLVAENSHLEDENENLRNEIAALSDRVDELNDEISELPVSGTDIRVAMFHAEGAMLAEFSRKEIGMAHIAYDFLLQELEGK